MASVILTASGAALGSKVGAGLVGGLGAKIGSFVGNVAGNAIDNHIFSNNSKKFKSRVGPRLSNLEVQSSAYGDMIPIIYGNARIAGNIIWSQPITETATTTTTSTGGGKGGGSGKVTTSTTTYSYSVTLAIAICEGPIDELVRVWADAKVLNPNDGVYRIYKGNESQLPDTLIESIEGVGEVPAYRGLAYIVMEDIPLADFGNRIPSFTFEVRKSALSASTSDIPLEEMINSMVMIPGSGEFVYDDKVQTKIPGQQVGENWVQQAERTRINQNNREGKADALVSLDQLASTCPNIEWLAVVVTWFGNSLDAASCTIKPAVEYQTGAITEPDSWKVGNFNRSTARQITINNGVPRYGGTPSDASLLRYIKEVKERGYKVMFYPMIFMDIIGKPWRGSLTGDPTSVGGFFNKTNGYNEFINHYINLVKDDIDAFVIGSELVGLTSVQDSSDNSFPAVDALIDLAATVKTTVGANVKVTYAADWSEYHHTTGGWYNLDPLWASDNIDFVGIDAYFPLTDQVEPAAGFPQNELQNGWLSGEGYDWYYDDQERTNKLPLDEQYAWKNIAWWWNNSHINPDSTTTAWSPQMKKIWFTEFGFPSVDGASNQPNVFIDPDSTISAFPYHSKERVSFRSQRNAIKATLTQWQGSAMVERMFLWTWDARPFPFWPDLTNIWSDGGLWKTGHWVNGKLGLSSLGAIVSDISQRTGLNESQIDVTRLNNLVDGYVINNETTARNAIDSLRAAYFFDVVESSGLIKYVPRGSNNIATISGDKLIPNNAPQTKGALGITRMQELELPQKIDVNYINKVADYQLGNQHAQRSATNSFGVETLLLPIVMGNREAKIIADISLYNSWLQRTLYSFILPIQYIKFEPTDIIDVTIGNAKHTIRITDTQYGSPGMIKISGVAEDVTSYDFYSQPGEITPQVQVVTPAGDTILAILDLPALPTDTEGQGSLRYAATGLESAWDGAVIYRSDDGGANYSQIVNTPNKAAIGAAIDILPPGPTDIFDEAGTVTVSITGTAQLAGVSELAVLNGANLAKLGPEILQFKNATLISAGKYQLTGLLRGRLGTENAIGQHQAGEEFILLDNNIVKEAIPNSAISLSRLYKPVTIGATLATTNSLDFVYAANSLKPFSPVHITATRDDSHNITIHWIRRTRINGGWQDNVEVPLGEDQQLYEVDIMNDEQPLRTISGLTSQSANYSASEQITDFGLTQSSVSIRVYQVSAIIGRGTAGIATI